MIPEFIKVLSLPEIKIEKGTMLLKEGKLCQNIYIVVNGSARLYFTYRKKELTTQFFFAGEAIAAVHSFLDGCCSIYSADAIEDCKMLVLSKAICNDLLQKNEVFRNWFYRAVIKIEFMHSYHLQDVLQRRARDRFRQMELEQPNWLHNIEPRYLASYLGISKLAFNQVKSNGARQLAL